MALGWLTILKMVPWGDVIENAPKVAQGARKLWDRVGKKPALGSTIIVPSATSAEPMTLVQLQTQVAALQQTALELQQQLLESTALIQSLAEQNTQLIARVGLNVRRLKWLSVAFVLLLIGLAVKFSMN